MADSYPKPGDGGAVNITGGAGGPDGPGAPINITGGAANEYGPGQPVNITGGAGGSLTIVNGPPAKPAGKRYLTEPMSLIEIGNWFNCHRNQVRKQVLDKYWHDAVGKKYRLQVSDMPTRYHVHHSRPRPAS
ncbi:MAG: hypothetical protein GX594_12700 [Pirellulaceae bacterium]|nr:hypothetical protein [Pirellulaceae bacterium]